MDVETPCVDEGFQAVRICSIVTPPHRCACWNDVMMEVFLPSCVRVFRTRRLSLANVCRVEIAINARVHAR